MEFAKWQEYLIKLACALYIIDPSEVGFPSGQSSESQPMYESSNASRLKFSKDKGLNPLLKFIEAKINKYIVSQLHSDFEFKFVGIDADTHEQYLTKIKDEITNFKTINEIRQENNLTPVDGGDIIMNPTYTGFLQQQQMAEQQEMMGGGEEMEGEGESPEEPDFEGMGIDVDEVAEGAMNQEGGEETPETPNVDAGKIATEIMNEAGGGGAEGLNVGQLASQIADETVKGEVENPFYEEFNRMLKELERGEI